MSNIPPMLSADYPRATIASPGTATASATAAGMIFQRCPDASAQIANLTRFFDEINDQRLKEREIVKQRIKRRDAISDFRQQHGAPMLIHDWDADLKMMFAISYPEVKL